jgi:hypothetical protein
MEIGKTENLLIEMSKSQGFQTLLFMAWMANHRAVNTNKGSFILPSF